MTVLPSPQRIALELAAVGMAAAALQAALLSLRHPYMMAIAAVTAVAVLGYAVFTVARTATLYRTAERLRRAEDAPPPSRAALRDAVLAPRRAAAFLAGLAAVEVVLVVLSLGDRADPHGIWHFSVLAVGSMLGATPLVGLGYRRALRPWIVTFDPAEVAPIRGASFARVAAMSATALVLAAGLIATSIGALSEETREVALILGASTTLALSLIAGLVAARIAGGLSSDVRHMRGTVAASAEAGGPDGADSWAPDDSEPVVLALAEALESVTTAIRQSADVEQRVKSTIEETQQKKTIFMASMSHDLRGPLNSIMGFSELLVSGIGGELTDGQRQSVAVIQRSGSELLELLNDIIDSARLEASRLPLRHAWTPTVELLTVAIQKGRDMVALRTGTGEGFTIEEEVEPGLPPLYVDSHRIVQAILCIFRHATLAMEGGAIRLSASAEGDGVRVSITDAGSVVANDDRERVFQAFRAMTSVSGRRIGGMGLSLSLARSLVRAHGGEVHYDASAGGGTTFHLSIPADGPT